MAGFDLIVRAFFADGGLSAGLAKANAGLNQLGKSGPGARAGLRAVEIGARQLAFQAAGLSGGIGQLARGLLMFGGGSALMLGAVAGIGAIAFAYRALTKDTREAAEEQKKLREELVRTAAQRAGALVPQTQMIGAQTQDLREMLAEQDTLRRQRVVAATQAFITAGGAAGGQSLAQFLENDKKLQAIDAIRAELSLAIAQNRRASADAGEKEADALKRAADEQRRLKLEGIQFLQAMIQLEKGGVFRALPISFNAPRFGAEGLAPGPSVTTFGNIRSNVPRFVPGEAPKPPSHLMEDLRAAQMMTMSLMMMRGGGTGGALAGLGGLASSAAGLSGVSAGLAGVLGPVGLGLTAVGGIFSMFDNSEERRHRELVRTIEKMGKEVGLERVTVVFTGPDGHQVRKSLAELEESDAVERVPGPVGVGG